VEEVEIDIIHTAEEEARDLILVQGQDPALLVTASLVADPIHQEERVDPQNQTNLLPHVDQSLLRKTQMERNLLLLPTKTRVLPRGYLVLLLDRQESKREVTPVSLMIYSMF